MNLYTIRYYVSSPRTTQTVAATAVSNSRLSASSNYAPSLDEMIERSNPIQPHRRQYVIGESIEDAILRYKNWAAEHSTNLESYGDVMDVTLTGVNIITGNLDNDE